MFNTKTSFFLLQVVVPVFIGMLVYMLLRPELLFEGYSVPGWIKYNLPDGLWTFALSSFLYLVWGKERENGVVLWLFSPLAVSFSFELAQLKFGGTFDWWDILSYTIGYAISFIVNNFKNYKRPNQLISL